MNGDKGKLAGLSSKCGFFSMLSAACRQDWSGWADGRAVRLWALLIVPVLAWAGPVQGRITDGSKGIPGVRVYPDRLRSVRPVPPVPVVLTDAEGRFTLELEASDTVLAVEKRGWQRDLVPLAELAQPVVLHAAPEFRVEKALVVRLDFPDEKGRLSDEELRSLLFGRQPGFASAANYVYEVSKGSLELAEGALRHVTDPQHLKPRSDAQRDGIAEWVLAQLKGEDLTDFDLVDNRSGALQPDGKPDHLWIIPPGLARNATTDPGHLSASSFLLPLPWQRTSRWGVVFFTEETPLGNIVHELFHAMGEHRVDDLYLDCGHPLTAGIWDLMDAGQYRGWDRVSSRWQEDVGYSPSHPGGWVRTDLWYRGRFKSTTRTLKVTDRAWTGWLEPLLRATGNFDQRLVVPDARRKGRFWNLEVRRPWGFDRGRIGNRWGPGCEGLVVSQIDPSMLTEGQPRGAVRVLDAHPGTPEPPMPRFPCGRWELDDAAFNLGKGENPRGSDGPLSWEVLAVDDAGRMKVSLRLR
jgi:M6 family metalloprotease-like protein